MRNGQRPRTTYMQHKLSRPSNDSNTHQQVYQQTCTSFAAHAASCASSAALRSSLIASSSTSSSMVDANAHDAVLLPPPPLGLAALRAALQAALCAGQSAS